MKTEVCNWVIVIYGLGILMNCMFNKVMYL